jgi:hypothetical protein
MGLREFFSTWFRPKAQEQTNEAQPIELGRSKSSVATSDFPYTPSQKTAQLCEHSTEPGVSEKWPTFTTVTRGSNGGIVFVQRPMPEPASPRRGVPSSRASRRAARLRDRER